MAKLPQEEVTMAALQTRLPFKEDVSSPLSYAEYRAKVITALSDELDFHDEDGRYASHNFHSFPAKFPPQLPRKFILELTAPGEVVLDPMVGSGTTAVEAFLSGRQAIGFDIDPLALLITRTKVMPLDADSVLTIGNEIVERARSALTHERQCLEQDLLTRWDPPTKKFIDYWFRYETQLELIALLRFIELIQDPGIRDFFRLAFSAIIITKSGGVSLALDLGHTRPHRVKYIVSLRGVSLADRSAPSNSPGRLERMTKTIRSPLEEFARRFRSNLKGLCATSVVGLSPLVAFGSAQQLPLPDRSVDLIVTSPPYAANAIDYMRAHKFSLVWMGHSIDSLTEHRKKYIGGEATADIYYELLPDMTETVVRNVTNLDVKKGCVLRRYYSEMTRVLREMFRVLKPGRGAIVIVGNSTLRGVDTQTQNCLAEIGQAIGFDVPAIGVRKLDRDRRMLPTGAKSNSASQIEQRMHQEYVIGLLKPHSPVVSAGR